MVGGADHGRLEFRMMGMLKATGLAAVLSVGVAAAPAAAAVTIQHYSFTATTDGPITSHSGKFAIGIDDVTDEYSLVSIDFSIGATVFDLSNTSFLGGDGTLLIGGGGSVTAFTFGEDDFVIQYKPGALNRFYYTSALDPTDSWRAPLEVVLETGGVPEPATWALMILGFSAVGAMARRRSGAALA